MFSFGCFVQNCNRRQDSIFIGFNDLSIHDHFIQYHMNFVEIKHYLQNRQVKEAASVVILLQGFHKELKYIKVMTHVKSKLGLFSSGQRLISPGTRH